MTSPSLPAQHGHRKIEKSLIEQAKKKRITEACANRFRQRLQPA